MQHDGERTAPDDVATRLGRLGFPAGFETLNPDFKDMLSALSDAGVEFVLVGAYALAAHGLPRATGDIDIWIRPSSENAQRVWQASKHLGHP